MPRLPEPLRVSAFGNDPFAQDDAEVPLTRGGIFFVLPQNRTLANPRFGQLAQDRQPLYLSGCDCGSDGIGKRLPRRRPRSGGQQIDKVRIIKLQTEAEVLLPPYSYMRSHGCPKEPAYACGQRHC
jgi:hypothetical protein